MGLLAGSALLFCWRLDVSGLANPYYSAAAQAGATSWKAFFFGSLDAGNAITIDKPPLGMWPIDLSVRAFGLSSWSVLLPQAIEGVCSVGVLYTCVRRTTRVAWPAFLAGAVFALTPVSVLVFRYNNPDAMLTLLLLCATYTTLRSVESRHPAAWMTAAGLLVGLAFLTKMLAAFLVLPALWLAYLVAAPSRPLTRARHLLWSGLAVVAGAGWWMAIVELWPRDKRPYVGGSTDNSVLGLALGYNGVSRLTGSSSPFPGGGFGATNMARIVRTDVGGEIGWYLPAACVLLAVTVLVRAGRTRRSPETAALLLWGGWLVTSGTTFALMEGIFHSYYTVEMAPAVCALIAIGTWRCWAFQHRRWVRRLAAVLVGVSAVVAGAAVAVCGPRWFMTAGVLTAIGVLAAVATWRATARRTTWGVGLVAVATLLAGPAIYDVATITTPHVGSGPMAGPGHGAPSSALVAWSPGEAEPFGSDLSIGDGVEDVLEGDAGAYRWVAAAPGAPSAAAYQLAVGAPVLAIGGYKGTDPLPDLNTFIALVEARQIHWFIPGGTYGTAAHEIQDWVVAHFPLVQIEGRSLYELA